MKKTLVVYGSSTGTCQDLAERIAKKLGLPSDCVVDVAKLTNTQIADAEALLLGSSTWDVAKKSLHIPKNGFSNKNSVKNEDWF